MLLDEFFVVSHFKMDGLQRHSKFTVLLTVLLFASFAPSLLKTSTSASSLGPASHMVDSLSSLSGLELGSSPATSSNGCSSGITEAGRTWQVIYSLHLGRQELFLC